MSKIPIEIKVPQGIATMIENCNSINYKTCSQCRHKNTCKEYQFVQKLKKLEEEYNAN